MKFKYTMTALTIAALAAGLTGCAPKQATNNAKTANLVYPNWAEGVAFAHLAQVVLEDKMGYKVELTAADVAPGYIAVAQGSHDAFMDCWPTLHRDYLNRYADKLVKLGNVYEGTEVGLVVPSYVTIDTLAELQEHAAKFKGVITGLDAGAGEMRDIENKLIPQYGLTNMKLMSSSEPAMCAALGDAIKHKEWIVIAGWKPHWMFSRWDVKFLKQDADKIIWRGGNLVIIGRVNLKTDKPELAQFLSTFQLTDAELGDLEIQINESDKSTLEVARQWMADHPASIARWIPTAK